MAYTIPDFNLLVGHFRMSPPHDFTTSVSLGQFAGQLRNYGSHPRGPFSSATFTVTGTNVESLLCPAGTDIRDISCTGTPIDGVEIPVGSGRYYVVLHVDDVAKGFPNEYRIAALAKQAFSSQVANWPLWPAPIP